MSVYILNIGAFSPFYSGDLYGRTILPPITEILLEGYGSIEKSIAINREYLNGLDIPSKGLMSLQTRLAFIAYKNTNISNLFDNINLDNGVIYVANGHISLDDETIEIIKKNALDEDNHFDFPLLGKNIDKMPPLDGIKMLSTAVSHFVAKDLSINVPGHQIYTGDNNSLAAVVEAYFKLKNLECDFALTVSSETPFFKHSYPYRDAALNKKTKVLGEGSFACLMISDRVLNNINKNIAKHLYEIEIADNKLYSPDISSSISQEIYYGSAHGLAEIYESLYEKRFSAGTFNNSNNEAGVSTVNIKKVAL